MKPDNVLIDYQQKNGCAKLKRLALTDFGVSSVTKNEMTATKSGTVRNQGATPLYMAPEQKKHKCYQYLTDVYGFGCTMADIFFGIKIECGKRLKDLQEIKVETEIERGVKKILIRCLKEQPKDRYPHMLDI